MKPAPKCHFCPARARWVLVYRGRRTKQHYCNQDKPVLKTDTAKARQYKLERIWD